MVFFFSDCTESGCFLEMGLDMKRLHLQLRGGLALSLIVQLAVLTPPTRLSGGLIKNERFVKEGNIRRQNKARSKENFCFDLNTYQLNRIMFH